MKKQLKQSNKQVKEGKGIKKSKKDKKNTSSTETMIKKLSALSEEMLNAHAKIEQLLDLMISANKNKTSSNVNEAMMKNAESTEKMLEKETEFPETMKAEGEAVEQLVKDKKLKIEKNKNKKDKAQPVIDKM